MAHERFHLDHGPAEAPALLAAARVLRELGAHNEAAEVEARAAEFAAVEADR